MRKLVSSGSPYEAIVCTVVQVSGLIDPDWLVEIEADAVIDDLQAPP